MESQTQIVKMEQYFDLGNHDFINDNIQYINLPNQQYTFNINFNIPNFLHVHEYKNKVQDITKDNFKKIKNYRNYPNNIISFKKINDTHFINVKTGGEFCWQIQESKLILTEINEDPKIKSDYLNLLKILKYYLGICPVKKRINEIQLILNNITDIKSYLNNNLLEIVQNLNSKPKHHNYNSQYFSVDKNKFNTNNKYRDNINNHACSCTSIHKQIFENKTTYLKAIDYIKKNINVNIMSDEQLEKIFNNKDKTNNEKVIDTTNLYLLSDMLEVINSYITYLTSCIKNLENDPYSLNDKFSHNNAKEDIIYIPPDHNNQYELFVKKSNIYGYVREKRNYYKPSGYILFEHNNEWNIIFYCSKTEITEEQIEDEKKWIEFNEELNKNANKQYKQYKNSKYNKK